MIDALEIQGMVPRSLVKTGDECLEHLLGFLLHDMEMGLHTMLLVRAGEGHGEPHAKRFLGKDRSLGKIHESSPGWLGQAYMKVACHDDTISASPHDSGDIDL